MNAYEAKARELAAVAPIEYLDKFNSILEVVKAYLDAIFYQFVLQRDSCCRFRTVM